VLEPLIRDTAAAIAAAIADLAESDPDRMVLVLPSDHQISDARRVLRGDPHRRPGAGRARRHHDHRHRADPAGNPVWLYRARRGDGPVYDVSRFREKPDLETAETFLRSGRFFWNGGIFMFRAGEMAAELARQQPEVWAQAKRGGRARRHRGQMLPA
jgi:mannose-1-phosphate guanylyltransferase